MCKQEEMRQDLADFVQLLIDAGYQIDPDEVDYETSLKLMEAHEVLDFSEVESERDERLAELRNLMRAVYRDGSLIVDCQAEITAGTTASICKCMSNLYAGIWDEKGDYFHFGYSPKRVIRSDIQVLSPKGIKTGNTYMLYRHGQAASLIQVTSVGKSFFRYITFLYDDCWAEEKLMNFTNVGIVQQRIGPKGPLLWGIKNYLEPV